MELGVCILAGPKCQMRKHSQQLLISKAHFISKCAVFQCAPSLFDVICTPGFLHAIRKTRCFKLVVVVLLSQVLQGQVDDRFRPADCQARS